MIETTTTTDSVSERGDILTRIDERIGDAIERAIRDEGVSPPVARAIRRNKVRNIGDSVIDAKRLQDAARAAGDKG